MNPTIERRDPEKYQRIVGLVLAGANSRKIAEEENIAARTAWHIRHEILKFHEALGRPLLCGCGAPINHQWLCRVRYGRSPKRQAIIRRWQAKAWLRNQEQMASMA